MIQIMKEYLSVPEKIKPGTPWRIFIKAEDKDGDMKNKVAVKIQWSLLPAKFPSPCDILTRYSSSKSC